MRNRNGQIFIFFLMVTTLGLLLTIGLLSLQAQSYRTAKRMSYIKEATYLAEAGLDKGYATFKTNNSYTGETLTLGNGSVTISVTPGSTANERYVSAIATVKGNIKKLRTKLVTEPNSTAIAFNYAMQVGTDGLTMGNNSVINGSVYSNGNISGGSNITINGDASAVGAVGSNITVTGIRKDNAPAQPLPGFDAAFWKQKAQAGGTYSGGYVPPYNATIGPYYIDGSFNSPSNSVIYITGPIYVKGNIILGNSTTFVISESLGKDSAMLVTEGSILFGNNTVVASNSNKGTLLMVSLSTSASAINISNNAITQIGPLYAPNGTVFIGNNAHAVAFTGKRMSIGANVIVDYDSGLATATYSYGIPTGTWIMEKGSYEEY